MVDSNTDFYSYKNNFEQYSNIESILVYGNEEILDKVSITIVIPTFNREKLLKEAIDSALNQDGFNDYCIIVADNNPSRDCDTEKLILQYNNNKILYYKHQQNIGMFGNHNRCFELAKSKWVSILHDDDLLLPSYLKICMNFLNAENDIDGLQPRKYFWNEKNQLNIPSDLDNSKKAKLEKVYDISNYYKFKSGAPTGVIFRRDAFIETGGFSQDFFPTSDFVFSVVFSYLHNLYILHKKLVIYRILENESTKAEILQLFLHNDFFLKSAIMHRYHVPRLIINVLCSKSIEKYSASLQNEYNNNFLPDLDNMPYYLKPNELVYQIFRTITSAYVKLLTNVIFPLKR